MSLYILTKSVKQIENIEKKLLKEGYEKSKYDFDVPKEKAVGVYTYDDGALDLHYGFLSEEMCSTDPYTSWINNREQCLTEEEFFSKI